MKKQQEKSMSKNEGRERIYLIQRKTRRAMRDSMTAAVPTATTVCGDGEEPATSIGLDCVLKSLNLTL